MADKPKRGSRSTRTASKSTAKKSNNKPSKDKARPADTNFVVKGVVRDRNNAPVPGVTVRAYDQDLRDHLIGETRSDEQGYSISYSRNDLSRPEKFNADLFVVTVDREGKESPPSEVIRNAPAEATIDPAIVGDAQSKSEFQQIVDTIMPILEGQGANGKPLSLGELDVRDVTFIATKTGIASEKISALVNAAKAAGLIQGGSSDRSDIPAEVFYGWFRRGLPQDPTELWSRKTNELIAQLTNSIDAKIAPAVLSERIGDIEATLKGLKAAKALEPAGKNNPPSLGDLLGTLPHDAALSDGQRLTFAKLHDEYGETDDLWNRAKDSGLGDAIPALKRTFELGNLTRRHSSLMTALQSKSDSDEPESLEFLTTLEPIEWIELVFEHGVPPGSDLDQAAYIEQLGAEVEKKFPTQMLTKQLERPVSDNSRFPDKKVRDFLKANAEFNFRGQHVEPYLRKIKNEDDDLRNGLLQLQRLDALTGNARETVALRDLSLGSGSEIVNTGYAVFSSLVSDTISSERAKKIYAAAEKKVITAMAMDGAIGRGSTWGKSAAVIPAPGISDELRDDYPSLRTLFGDLDYCECRHCQSVLGPAAYLTDLLHILQRFPLKTYNRNDLPPPNDNHDLDTAVGGTVLGALLQRRPDLADLELSCENTNTEIPYIDLVLEVLENAVALPWDIDIDTPEFAGIAIEGELAAGKVPEPIISKLRDTSILVGKSLTVVRSPLRNPALGDPTDWIIKDGSRRWLLRLQKRQLTLSILVPTERSFQLTDINASVDSLENGTLSTEILGRLSLPELPIDGVPQVQDRGTSSLGRGWLIRYNRAIAIKRTVLPNGDDLIEWFKLDGTKLNSRPGSPGWKNFSNYFTSGQTSKIDPYVAHLLRLPKDEIYTQTWNRSKEWWELRTSGAAKLVLQLGRLTIAGLTYQNSSIREHLKASPENRNPRAYDILSGMDVNGAATKAVFPWALPFDLWLEETRGFLEALGIPRVKLIDIARPQSRLEEVAATLELLGLSKSEADIFDKASENPWRYWGLEIDINTVQDHTAGKSWQGKWLEILTHLSMVLQQSGLSYREYLNLLQTNFIGQRTRRDEEVKPTLAPLDKDHLDECKTSNLILTGIAASGLNTHLQRAHVFTRLWRKLGWTMRDLDLALTAFGGNLTQQTLQDLALMKRLQGASGLPIAVLVACIDMLNTEPWTEYRRDGSPIERSLYDIVFQRESLRSPVKLPSVTGTPVAEFEDFASEKLSSSTLTASAGADFIAAALGVKANDVTRWITGTPNLGIANELRLGTLSRLYAAASVCRSLGVSANDLPDILAVLGEAANFCRTLTPPPAAAGRAQQARERALSLLEFLERVSYVRQSAFDFESLSYILRHKTLRRAGSDPSVKLEQQLGQTLMELRSAMLSGDILGDLSVENVRGQLTRVGWYPALVDSVAGRDGLSYIRSASVDISPPQQEPVIPLKLRSKFTYRKLDAAKDVLECAGYLEDADFDEIETLNLPAGKVAELKTNYNHELITRADKLASLMRTFKLPEFVSVINNPPSAPVIPDRFNGRLAFEMTSATTGTLTLRGWLPNDDKDYVAKANSGNATLLPALNDVQTQAESYKPEPTETFITPTDAEKLLREADFQERNRTVLLRLRPRLVLDTLATQLTVSLGLDKQAASMLLAKVSVNARAAKDLLTDSKFLTSDPKQTLDRQNWPDEFGVVELLGKIATIASSLTILPEQWEWVLDGVFDVLDLLLLPTGSNPTAAQYEDWRKLVDLFHLRDVLPDGPKYLAQVRDALKQQNINDVRTKVHELFAVAFELKTDDVSGACAKELLNFDATGPKDYRNPSRLLELVQLLNVIKVLGTDPASIRQLIQPQPKQEEAQVARKLFAASLDPQVLPDRLRPISDRLRHLQRNAFVAYLIQRDHLPDSNELFDRYLIDVEMGSCMMTSRVKQALSSVQLFVQRCLLNLEQPVNIGEPGVRPDSIDARRWEWMKYYRVWEANRKVFLWPENWIEPELRDDKSDLFRSLESDLLQNELTHDTALLAFRKYADGLGDLARLTVVSMFDEKQDDDTIVHIIGRDNSQPYKHYYRQWRIGSDDYAGDWTPWEQISTQVDSEHVIVFRHAGSVHLAWPTITKKQTELQWKVQMNLARRNTSGWTKLKKGRGEFTATMVPDKDESESFVFRFTREQQKSRASIDCFSTIDSWAVPWSPQSEFVTVPPRGKRKSDDTENRLNRLLELKTRYLIKYRDQNDAVWFKIVPPSEVTLTATLVYILSKSPFLDSRTKTIPSEPFPLFFGGATPDWLLVDLKKWFFNGDAEAIGLLDFILVSLQAEIKGTRYIDNVVKTEIRSLATDANWSFEFIFEVKKDGLDGSDPDFGHNRKLRRQLVGRFEVRDDDSLDQVAADLTDIESPLEGTDYFDSGYAEIGDKNYALIVGSSSVLQLKPGLFFTLSTARTAPQEFWAYRDSELSLLLWRFAGLKEPNDPDGALAGLFRVVSMNIAGTDMLRRQLSAAAWNAVANLPGLFGSTSFVLTHEITNVSPLSELTIEIAFSNSPSSSYYWETFFHIPLMVATQLSKGQRFEEAQRWFHLIFDPTTNDAIGHPAHYWRFKPFRENTDQRVSIEQMLTDLAQGKLDLNDEINAWAEKPFRPHLIARHRYRAYQITVVLKYLENLIAWADQLFRRDTIESINEATQLYVLAARILGKRPASSPKRNVNASSYRDIQAQLDSFSNAWIPFESLLVSDSFNGELNGDATAEKRGIEILNSLGTLSFCVPYNEKLSEYWDSVEDRLFKIRHCMNIEGTERQLPLFEPPIDPALLVRATAAGLDIASVLSEMYVPLPLYRFSVIVQKASELCGEVKALGNALLAALEKKDAEQLSRLRSSHEIQMLKLVREIKVQQQKEAETNLEALRKTRESVSERYMHYQRLMAKQNIAVPAEGVPATLESSALQLTPADAGDSDAQGLALISSETDHLRWLNIGNNYSITAGVFNTLAGISHLIPDTAFGTPFSKVRWGGSHLGSAFNAAGSLFSTLASNASFQANRSAIIGGHQRRYDEWQFQSNSAAKELEQIDKQIAASDIRRNIAEREISNHDQQIEDAQEIDDFMRDKFSNQELYSWTVGQISRVYFRTYQLAYDMSKRAEACYRRELGLKDSNFIQFGYWDSLKKGLLSGEGLHHDLKRLEIAYLDQNKREYEITKHISVAQFNPLVLLRLKESETNTGDISLTEALFDLDYPGHYMRRIKSVSVTIPCVTGPYASVDCTLRLLKSSIRYGNTLRNGKYARDAESDDPRFADSFGEIQSIVTSSGQNDSGMFETNLHDERYLPFEGTGVISDWRLELPRHFHQFDYDTISDVILHIRYTARDGGSLLKDASAAELQTALNDIVRSANETGLVQVFSLRHQFPSEWYRLTSADGNGDHVQAFPIPSTRFPFLFQGKTIKISKVDLYAVPNADIKALQFPKLTVKSPGVEDALNLKNAGGIGQLPRKTATEDQSIPVGNTEDANSWSFTVGKDDVAAFQKNVKDILLVLGYEVSN